MNSLSGINVCFLVGTLGQGGAERQLFYMLQCLKDQGADLKVFCLTRGEYYEKKILKLCIPVIWVGRSEYRPFRLIRIFTDIVNSRPDIFQSSHSYTNLYVTIVSCLLGIKSISAIRSNFIADVFTPDRFLNLMGLRLSKNIVCNSKNALINAINNGIPEQKLYYLRNVINANYFKPLTKDKKENIINLLSVGSLIKLKRYDRIIKILSEIKKYGIKYKAKIVGSGILENELKEQAKIRGLLPENLEFVESNPDILKHYQWADIFLHTSEFEGTPNVVMEAMACGLPVVATNVGDIPLLIENGKSGFYHKVNDIKGLLTSLIRLVKSQNLRDEFGKNGRNRMLRNHSFNNLLEQQLELYSKVLK